MRKQYRPVPAAKVFAGMSAKDRAAVKARAEELIAEEYALRDLRKAKRITQEEVARRLGGRQVYVSRLENRADMKLSSLRKYVGAIGGDLRLVVTFPEGRTVGLRAVGTEQASGKRTLRSRQEKT